MIRDTGVGVGFARSWLSGRADVVRREVELDRGDRHVPATVYEPARSHRGERRRGWVLLHGATVPGREHASLVRFARSVAHTGAVAIVPEVPEWRELRLSPALTLPTVRACLPVLRAARGVASDQLGLIGFSFGAPHAILTGAHPEIQKALRVVVGFGGYSELASTLHFLFLGEHEWRGARHRVVPDPYGRWIVAGNYLTTVPGYSHADDVARALLELAGEAGRRGVFAGDPVYDAFKHDLRERLPASARPTFDLIAPDGDSIPDDRAAVEHLLEHLGAEIRRTDPQMDPGPRMAKVRVPVRLVHGHGDTLIPFTETLRMGERLEGATDVRVTITRLFSHSQDEGMPAGLRMVAEQARFVRAVGRVLRMS